MTEREMASNLFIKMFDEKAFRPNIMDKDREKYVRDICKKCNLLASIAYRELSKEDMVNQIDLGLPETIDNLRREWNKNAV